MFPLLVCVGYHARAGLGIRRNSLLWGFFTLMLVSEVAFPAAKRAGVCIVRQAHAETNAGLRGAYHILHIGVFRGIHGCGITT